jgi:hypothetical protein
MDQLRPIVEAVVAGDLVLRPTPTDPAFTLVDLGLLAEMLKGWARW